MKPKTMKLYIWEDAFGSYFPGIMFAVASSLKEAKEILIKENSENLGILLEGELSKEPSVYSMKNPLARICQGGD